MFPVSRVGELWVLLPSPGGGSELNLYQFLFVHKSDRTTESDNEAASPPPMETTESQDTPIDDSRSYKELVTLVNAIAKPMAKKKLTKKLYKAVKKAQKAKRLKRGVREVVKGLRKSEKGVVVLAGDVSPILGCHLAHTCVLSEEKGVPYSDVPSQKGLGAAALTKRPTSVVIIQLNEEYKKLYDECYSSVDALPLPIMSS